MKTQIVYSLVCNDKAVFVEEFWASIYSLRLYHSEVKVVLLLDEDTLPVIKSRPFLESMITEIKVVPVPKELIPKERSRVIKTSVRGYIEGAYLFVDTDTIIAGNLDYIDSLTCDVAACLEFHLPLADTPYRKNVLDNMRRAFDMNVSKEPYWFNSGVMYVADNERTHELYRRWHENWKYSAFDKKMNQDQPCLFKADIDMGHIITQLPGEYNCQPCMSLKYLSPAKIIHFLHFPIPLDKSFCPFMDKSIYWQIKRDNCITDMTAEMIRNVKQSFASPSCAVGWRTMNFMTSPAFPVFEKIFNEGGAVSWLMLKVAGWLEWLHKYTRKK